MASEASMARDDATLRILRIGNDFVAMPRQRLVRFLWRTSAESPDLARFRQLIRDAGGTPTHLPDYTLLLELEKWRERLLERRGASVRNRVRSTQGRTSRRPSRRRRGVRSSKRSL